MSWYSGWSLRNSAISQASLTLARWCYAGACRCLRMFSSWRHESGGSQDALTTTFAPDLSTRSQTAVLRPKSSFLEQRVRIFTWSQSIQSRDGRVLIDGFQTGRTTSNGPTQIAIILASSRKSSGQSSSHGSDVESVKASKRNSRIRCPATLNAFKHVVIGLCSAREVFAKR